jgi:hypothetical protein
MLTEVLADNKSAMLADAIVSAWLDAEAGTEAVLAACLACLESTVVDDSIRLVAPRKLGNSLRIKLAGQYLPEKLPPADAALSTRLLAALNNGANAGLPPNSAVTIIVALESATVNADASRTLAMFARNAPAAQVRCFAIQRMGMHAGPAEIVATLGGAAYTPASADEQQVGAAIFTALRTSTDRCGGDRGVLHGWIRELLSRQATTTFAEQLYISMLNAIDREDARALQPLLTDLAAHSLSEAVRSGARSTLARSR